MCPHYYGWDTDASVRLRLQTRQLPTMPEAPWTWNEDEDEDEDDCGPPLRLATTMLVMVVVFTNSAE